MIINFSVQNFGSIKDKQTLSFEADRSKHLEEYYVVETNGLRLLKLALIYGANASGKTTILKALDFLHTIVLNPKSKKTDTFDDFEPFKFDENTPKQNTILGIEFLQNETRYLYEVELNREAIVREELYSYNSRKSNVFSRTTDLKNQATKIKFGNKIKIDKITEQNFENITLWNNTVLGGFLKINFYAKELKDVTDWFENYLNSLINSQTKLDRFTSRRIQKNEINKDVVLEILKKADLNISDILFKEEMIEIPSGVIDFIENTEKYRPNDSKDKEYKVVSDKTLSTINLEFEHVIKNRLFSLRFAQESQGTQRYYGFAGILFLLIKYSKIFIIDELETSLHPDLFQHFLLSFLVNAQKSQLVATTHNREILNNKDIFRNDAIWITDKDNENCATELYSLADFDTSVIRNTTNIYNTYKIGKLGGTPNLGSYYINLEDENNK
ncbi:transporter [Bacteroidia bacterium]|nr:transporter [Bacteroidia bacterium]